MIFKRNVEKVDISIIQKPDYIKFYCPHCKDEVSMSYGLFEDEIGVEYCDWKYSTFNCPCCKKEIGIDYIDWN